MSNQGSRSVDKHRRRFRETDLRRVAEVIGRVGASEPTARAVALGLVEADGRNVGTHGVVRLPSYRHQVEHGKVAPAASPSLVQTRGAKAFGAMTANFLMDLAVGHASTLGVGVAVARRCAHFGAAAHYVLRAARAGYVALAASNTPAVMAPYGGRSAAIGNNPLALEAPHAEGTEPLVLDMAQSVVARGTHQARRDGARHDSRALGDRARRAPHRQPDRRARRRAARLRGYKGYGIALVVEMLTSVMSGSHLSPERSTRA